VNAVRSALSFVSAVETEHLVLVVLRSKEIG
jgi:hypothetical protein